jgi:Ca-activated chloride channel homolog
MTSLTRNEPAAARTPLPTVLSMLPALLLLAVPLQLSAQGWIEPRPGPQPAQWGIEKLRTTVNVRVTDRVATVEVEEWFRNNGGGLGEGDYVYPLPGEAVFSSYSLYQGDQELRGELMDAARARDIYERIVRERRDPALIELVGKGMLRARVFPIEPGQTRRITLRYTQVLDRAGDALQFRYAAGRPSPGARLELPPPPLPMPMPWPAPQPRRQPQPLPESVPDHASRPLASVPIAFTITIADGARFRDAFSPTHALRVDRPRNGSMVVRPRDTLIGDFAVFLPFATSPVGVTLATHRPAGEAGWFMLTLSPGAVTESRVPRDVTAVVDVSGSMSGEKMEQARRALHQLLGTLGADDRIRLISFSSGVRQWRETWMPATRANLREAGDWIDRLRADGGTHISGALEKAFEATSPAERLPIVIFLTDGQPTAGVTQPDRIVALAESQRGRARIFAFGVGYDVNTYLLDRLSEAARGSTQYVQPNEDVEQAVSVLAAKVRHPVLTDLALQRGPVRMTDIYPRELPDLFAGEELVVFGRYEGSGQGSVAVTGRRGQRAERYAADVRFPARTDANDYIPRLWASRRLGDLDRSIRSARADGASPQQVQRMIEELRETALRYGLLSEYTAYLVQEPGMIVADGMRGAPSFAASAAPAPVAGQAAVARAEGARRAREVASVAQMEESQALAMRAAVQPSATGGAGAGVAGKSAGDGARVVAGRVFAPRDGVWVDARHTESLRVVTVEPYSAAYFALLRELPELGLVLRELDTALVAGERVSIRVQRGGARSMTAAELRRVATEFRTK